MDKNLYDLPPEELRDIPTVCGSLRDALNELQADHAFLMKGDVFSRDFIELYIELKWEEVYNFEHTPHPVEFQMTIRSDATDKTGAAARRRPDRAFRCPPWPALMPAMRLCLFFPAGREIFAEA